LLCLGCDREDCSVIVTQKINPLADVAAVPELALDAKMGAEEGTREFRYQFLGRIGTGAEASREIAVETRGVSAVVSIMPISA